MTTRSPYERIMIAAANGRGLRLSPEEVYDLACDDAIETVAVGCLSSTDYEGLIAGQFEHWKFWKKMGRKK